MKDNANLSDYLSRVTLRADTDDYDSVGGKISLMTVHAAKGLEFPIVYVVGLEEGLFPSMHGWDEDPDELEEERRLFYVAMTRAMKNLTLTNAKCRRTYGNFMFNDPARFLFEMPQNLLQYRDFSEGAYGNAFSKNTTGRSAKSYGKNSSGFASDSYSDYSSGSDYDYAQDIPEDDIVEYDMDDYGGDQAAQFRKGSRIKHPVYGIGVIRKKEGKGESTKVHVEFRDRSVRKFILKYANLSLV
jgi:DNA helicase-2/ATP-dependent DNA helicase PcrA